MDTFFIPEVEHRLKIFKALKDLIIFDENVSFTQFSTANEYEFDSRNKAKKSAALILLVRSSEIKYNHEILIDLDTDMEEEINKFLHEVFVRAGNINNIDFEGMESLFKSNRLDYSKFQEGQFNKDFRKVLMSRELLKCIT